MIYGIWVPNESFTQRDILIENSEISRVNYPIKMGGINTKGGIVIRNNSIHTSSASAIWIEGGIKEDPVIIEGNHIYNQLLIGTHHGSGLTLTTYPMTIRNNIIHMG